MRMWIRVVPFLLGLAAVAPAQSVVIDEGSFTFTRAGAPNGTESFKIIRRRGAEGTELVAQCTRTVDGRIVKTSLATDSAGNPTAYSRGTSGAAAGQITARRALNRLTVNEGGAQASSRDFVFSPGTLILDEDVIHQLHFITWQDGRNVAFLIPGTGSAGQAVLTEVGRESLTIGGATIAATRFALGTGDDRREIWIDSGKRLLKVTHPARQVVVVRDLPPR